MKTYVAEKQRWQVHCDVDNLLNYLKEDNLVVSLEEEAKLNAEHEKALDEHLAGGGVAYSAVSPACVSTTMERLPLLVERW